VLAQENMTADTLYDAILTLQKDKDSLIRNLTQAPPADGTMPVLKLIREAEKKS
jgi:hypothetical protein